MSKGTRRTTRGRSDSLLHPKEPSYLSSFVRSVIGFASGLVIGAVALTVGGVLRLFWHIAWNGFKDAPFAFVLMLGGAFCVGYARLQLLG